MITTLERKNKKVEFASENTVYVYEKEGAQSKSVESHDLKLVPKQTLDIAANVVLSMHVKKIFETTVDDVPKNRTEIDFLAYVFKLEVKKLKMGPLRQRQLLSNARVFFDENFWAQKKGYPDVTKLLEDKKKQNCTFQTGVYISKM